MKLLLVVCVLVAVATADDPPTPPDYGNYTSTYFTFLNLFRDQSFGSSGSGSEAIDYVEQRARYDFTFLDGDFDMTVLAFFEKHTQYSIITQNEQQYCFPNEITDDMYPSDFLQTKCHYAGEGEVFAHITQRWACPARQLENMEDTYEIFYLWTDMNRLQNPRRETTSYLQADHDGNLANLGTLVMDVLSFSKAKPADNLFTIPAVCDQDKLRDKTEISSLISPSSEKIVSRLLSRHHF